MPLRPREQFRHRPGHVLHPHRLVDEHDLRHAPRRLVAVVRDREVDDVGALAHRVDQPPVRQALDERAVEELLLLHREEVRAVDPDQVDAAAAVASGRLLRDHARHRLGGVLELDVVHLHAVALLDLGADPADERVGLLVAGPRVPVHRLAARARDDLVPRLRERRPGCRKGRTQREDARDACHEPCAHGHCPDGTSAIVFRRDGAAASPRAARRRACAASSTGPSTCSWKRSQPMQRFW